MKKDNVVNLVQEKLNEKYGINEEKNRGNVIIERVYDDCGEDNNDYYLRVRVFVIETTWVGEKSFGLKSYTEKELARRIFNFYFYHVEKEMNREKSSKSF